MISLITLTQGNPQALRRTVDNVRLAFGDTLTEVIVGDLTVLPGQFDHGFADVQFVPLIFNSLFHNGFASTLNLVATRSANDLCLYLNVGEIVESGPRINLISSAYNCYPFDHATDPHIWVRMWDRRELSWSGRIHEVVTGSRPLRRCPEILFRMADTPKDDADDLAAGIYNDIKAMVYLGQYVHIAEHPEDLAGTDQHWLRYGIQELDDLKRILAEKGERFEAFRTGDSERYLELARANPPSKLWPKPYP